MGEDNAKKTKAPVCTPRLPETVGNRRIAEFGQARYWDEYYEYISTTPMTAYERKLLRKWVDDGHSVYDDPGSRYYPTACYPRTFLNVYREDRRIEHVLRGKTPDEKTAWLKNYMGHVESTTAELEAAKAATPDFPLLITLKNVFSVHDI